MNVTIASACGNEGTLRPRFNLPPVEFINERRHGWTQEQLAHASTGHNRTTGKLTVAIGVRTRRNGLVRFDADLIKLDYDLSQDAIGRLYHYWHDLNAHYSLPKKILRRMECHFSKTTIIFDATAQQVNDWKDFLMAVLMDKGSYVGLDCDRATTDENYPSSGVFGGPTV